MSLRLLFYLCIFSLCLCRVSAQSVSLAFNNEIVLQNAVANTDFTVSDIFVNAIGSAINSAASSTAITTNVYTLDPHLVIVSNSWSTGTADTASANVAALQTTYAGWRSGGNSNINSLLNAICLNNIGRQPTLIDYIDNCTFGNSLIQPKSQNACLRNLSTSIITTLSNATLVRATLCSFLPTDCSLIVSNGVTSVTLTSNSISKVYQNMSFSVYAYDRNSVLITLVAYAQHASAVSSLGVEYIQINGIDVYYKGDPPTLTTAGTSSECVQKMWYLIFLIVLIPVILIVSQRFYLWGRLSGKNSIKKSERDVRAGVHLSATPWGNMNGGFQYGPPQPPQASRGAEGWGGLYPGVNGYGQNVEQSAMQSGWPQGGAQGFSSNYAGNQYNNSAQLPQWSYNGQ